MPVLTQGAVTVMLPDHVSIPESAGKLSKIVVQRMAKARRGVGPTCSATAAAMLKDPQRLSIPGVAASEVADLGRLAEDIKPIITDIETLLVVLKQSSLILDNDAHTALRRVIGHVRTQSRFDPRIVDLVPTLVEYFSHASTPPNGADPGSQS